jgi:hypothetical protein
MRNRQYQSLLHEFKKLSKQTIYTMHQESLFSSFALQAFTERPEAEEKI